MLLELPWGIPSSGVLLELRWGTPSSGVRIELPWGIPSSRRGVWESTGREATYSRTSGRVPVEKRHTRGQRRCRTGSRLGEYRSRSDILWDVQTTGNILSVHYPSSLCLSACLSVGPLIPRRYTVLWRLYISKCRFVDTPGTCHGFTDTVSLFEVTRRCLCGAGGGRWCGVSVTGHT